MFSTNNDIGFVKCSRTWNDIDFIGTAEALGNVRVWASGTFLAQCLPACCTPFLAPSQNSLSYLPEAVLSNIAPWYGPVSLMRRVYRPPQTTAQRENKSRTRLPCVVGTSHFHAGKTVQYMRNQAQRYSDDSRSTSRSATYHRRNHRHFLHIPH